MKNEFGVTLDRNGYAPSIFGESGRCALCGRRDRKLDRHEAFHGANRKKSKNLGMWLEICDLCHDKLHHHDASLDLEVKQRMQRAAMDYYGWTADEFRRIVGKSYI